MGKKRLFKTAQNGSVADYAYVADTESDVTGLPDDCSAVIVATPDTDKSQIRVKKSDGNFAELKLSGGSGGITEIETAAEMNALLVAANVGKAYMYTGTTTADYTNGDIYIVEEN